MLFKELFKASLTEAFQLTEGFEVQMRVFSLLLMKVDVQIISGNFSSIICSYMAHLLSPSSKNKKKLALKKFLYFLVFHEMELCFLKRKLFLYLGKCFRLKNQLNYTEIKDIRILFRLEKETEAIIDRILRDNKNVFEHEEEKNYYKPLRVSNFWSRKVTVIEIKQYQLKNILIKLDHI